MAFIKKTWLARIGVGLNRFRMNNSTDVVLESNPVSVTQQGDQLSADNMNNLETRIGNAFDEVENDFDKMAGNLAPIEVSPASTNHAVGTQIVYNGILYKVTSAISTNDNLVVGTNIEPYPVSSALSDIMSIYEHTLTYGKAVEYKFSNGLLIIYAEFKKFPTVGYHQSGNMYVWDVPINYVSFSFNTPFLTDFIDVHARPVSSGYMWHIYSNITKTKFNSVSFGAMYQSSDFDTMAVTITGFWK